MKSLVASVTNRGPEVLRPHLDSIKNLSVPNGIEIDVIYTTDPEIPEGSEELLLSYGVVLGEAEPKPSDALYAVTEQTHRWNEPTFDWLAHEKQRLLSHAVEEGYDAVFFVDSDLVLGPETLESLVYAQKPIVSAVFWTAWHEGAPPLPQTWLTHPYTLEGRSGVRYLSSAEFLRALRDRQLVEVGGLGACTLIRTNVLDRVGFFPRMEGLPKEGMWQGEDRSFCLYATQAHIPLWADAWPDIFHIYRPSDVSKVDDVVASWPGRVERPERGDLVSFTLEALEEPELASRREYVRGQLGLLRVLPEVEETLLSMNVGEERIVKLSFPLWWEIEPYRGKSKNVLLRLLDAKRPR